ncbi:calcium-activated chloride channel regulator 2-like [Amphiura filiformis]|uniref:calcium-activated chloride channel regulator 2-like n=1 Tax=Amphiura filiformis TaxID=82378 RepID=UPI003B21EE52
MVETSNLRSWILLIVILPVLNFTVIYAGNAIATDGGYRNTVVAIGERVPEDVTLLQRIKDDFTVASSFLFEATKNHLYFSEITILVPRSWTSYTAPDPIQSERFETSDFIIDVSQETRPNRPFTNKASGCGQPGRYVHFTPTFIADSNEASKYGGYGKAIAHEWAHYRWGVFDEYSLPGAASFYASSNGHYMATRCTLAIPGQAVATLPGKSDVECDPLLGEPPNHCQFVDDETTRTSFCIPYRIKISR